MALKSPKMRNSVNSYLKILKNQHWKQHVWVKNMSGFIYLPKRIGALKVKKAKQHHANEISRLELRHFQRGP